MIYLDHASTTPVDARIRGAMLPLWEESFYNPSSPYANGRRVKELLLLARTKAAEAIGAGPEEIIFTSGGTEADNLAIKGVMDYGAEKGCVITAATEHHAVLSSCEWLAARGCDVLTIDPEPDGRISPQSLDRALASRPGTKLVSIMWVNNETGAINPIREMAEISHRHGALFHTDAVQAAATQRIDARALGVDLLSLSAHKLYGPKGAGLLFCREGVSLTPLLHGGQQENHRRGGTENAACLVGLCMALELAAAEMPNTRAHLGQLKSLFLRELEPLPGWCVNGPDGDGASPAIVNIGFSGTEAEGLVLMCNHAGIELSMGAACNSLSVEPSHVLTAMRVPPEFLRGSIRISFGRSNTPEDIVTAAREIARIVAKLRRITGS